MTDACLPAKKACGLYFSIQEAVAHIFTYTQIQNTWCILLAVIFYMEIWISASGVQTRNPFSHTAYVKMT